MKRKEKVTKKGKEEKLTDLLDTRVSFVKKKSESKIGPLDRQVIVKRDIREKDNVDFLFEYDLSMYENLVCMYLQFISCLVIRSAGRRYT